MVEINKDILIEENELLKAQNKSLQDDVKVLETSLKKSLAKSSDLMIKFINIKANLSYCKKFNYSTDENYIKGFNKAFELISKCLNIEDK